MQEEGAMGEMGVVGRDTGKILGPLQQPFSPHFELWATRSQPRSVLFCMNI